MLCFERKIDVCCLFMVFFFLESFHRVVLYIIYGLILHNYIFMSGLFCLISHLAEIISKHENPAFLLILVLFFSLVFWDLVFTKKFFLNLVPF